MVGAFPEHMYRALSLLRTHIRMDKQNTDWNLDEAVSTEPIDLSPTCVCGNEEEGVFDLPQGQGPGNLSGRLLKEPVRGSSQRDPGLSISPRMGSGGRLPCLNAYPDGTCTT